MEQIKAKLLARPNRFVMLCQLESGQTVRAHCPNSSRLIGLLEDKPELLLCPSNIPTRKTDYTVEAIKNNSIWVGIYAARANDIFERYLQDSPEWPFSTWQSWRRERQLGSSRIDFCGQLPTSEKHRVEIKSLSSRWKDGTAFYSGTPSARGCRHLAELGQLVAKGVRASCIFVIQRSDVTALKPAPVTDPGWLSALRRARNLGVDIRAFNCLREEKGWKLSSQLEVVL